MTIRGYPPSVRVEPDDTLIMSGAPVSATRTWQQIAAGTNWLNGTGAQLIPGFTTNFASIADGTSQTLRFKAKTRAQAIERVWVVQLVAAKSGVTVALTPGSASTITTPVTFGGVVNAPIVLREPLASQTNTLTELTLLVAPTGGGVFVASVACWEQSRVSLEPSADDDGINSQSIRTRERIASGNYPTTIESVGGTYAALADADARRSGLWHFAAPSLTPVTRVGAYVDLCGTMPILTRKLTSGATTGAVYWTAYAKVSGSSGDISVTTSQSGVSDSVNITGTSYAWTTPKSISVSCEDLSTADGLQSGAWDDMTWQIRGNGGATISVLSVSVIEQ